MTFSSNLVPTLFFAALGLATAPQAQTLTPTSLGLRADMRPDRRPDGYTIVSGFNSDALHVYVTATGAFERTVAPVPGAQSVVTGADGLLYVCAEKVDEILRIDPVTWTILGPFVGDDPLTPVDETGGLDGPTGALFGPDGNLYVASFNTDEVLRYDGSTGAFLDVFVAAGSGGLNGPDAGLAFGADGHLYVPSFFTNSVLRYDGTTGASLGAFATAAPGNLRQPRGLVFHEGFCYVASSQNNRVLQYELDGTFVRNYSFANQVYGLAFHPQDEDLYLVSLGLTTVRRHDGASGVFQRTLFPAGSGGLVGAVYLHFWIP